MTKKENEQLAVLVSKVGEMHEDIKEIKEHNTRHDGVLRNHEKDIGSLKGQVKVILLVGGGIIVATGVGIAAIKLLSG